MPARPLHPRHSAQEDKIPQLTCEACNERKVRCDKQSPCSTCKATGVICVPIHRRRLPRGRHVASIGAEDQSLRERVARLEGLIAIRDPDSADNPTLTAISASTSGIDSPPPAVTSASSSTTCPVLYSASTALQRTKKAPSCRYLANGFWNELVDKVRPNVRQSPPLNLSSVLRGLLLKILALFCFHRLLLFLEIVAPMSSKY